MCSKEQQSCKQTIEDYYKPLFRFAYSLAKNEEDASDLTQQTFYIFAKKNTDLRDRSKVKSWLFTVLYREFLRYKRRSSKIVPFEQNLLEANAPVIEGKAAYASDSSAVLKAMEQMDEKYRAVLTLFYLKQHSYKEIASILGIPTGTVMSRISRGKDRLKTLLRISSVQ